MVICCFFQRGTCKFGSNCRNEHPKGGGVGGFGRQTSGQQNDRFHYRSSNNTSSNFGSVNNNNNKGLFGGGNQLKNKTTEDDNIVALTKKELQEWDVNKMWPLSCFSAQTEQKCLPGFKDTSPEELRALAYECQRNRQMNQYLEAVSDLLTQVMTRRNQLKSMSNQQLRHEIDSSNLNQQSSMGMTTKPAGFSGSTSTGLFGTGSQGMSTSTGLFGSNSKSTGLFGTNNASSSTGGLFSSNLQSTGLFGGKGATGNPFTSRTTNVSNPFASTGTSNSGGLFSSNKQTSSTSGGLFTSSSTFSSGLFSNNSSDGAPVGGLFSGGGMATSNPTSSSLPAPFGSSSAISNPFTDAATGTGGGLFSQQKSQDLFAGNTTQPSTQAPSNPFYSQQYINKQQQQNKQYDQLKTQARTTAVCTIKLPQVTQSDIEKFKAEKFTLGQIPTCPPPVELC